MGPLAASADGPGPAGTLFPAFWEPGQWSQPSPRDSGPSGPCGGKRGLFQLPSEVPNLPEGTQPASWPRPGHTPHRTAGCTPPGVVPSVPAAPLPRPRCGRPSWQTAALARPCLLMVSTGRGIDPQSLGVQPPSGHHGVLKAVSGVSRNMLPTRFLRGHLCPRPPLLLWSRRRKTARGCRRSTPKVSLETTPAFFAWPRRHRPRGPQGPHAHAAQRQAGRCPSWLPAWWGQGHVPVTARRSLKAPWLSLPREDMKATRALFWGHYDVLGRGAEGPGGVQEAWPRPWGAPVGPRATQSAVSGRSESGPELRGRGRAISRPAAPGGPFVNVPVSLSPASAPVGP